jgi:ubiquinone/menaquinone biosynthesis C-methylase UbiE
MVKVGINNELDYLKNNFPSIYQLVDKDLYDISKKFIVDNYDKYNDFDTEIFNSRGANYIRAQDNLLVRKTGILHIFNQFKMEKGVKILDCLGGNGLLTKVINHTSFVNIPTIITSDISEGMIINARTNKLPAIRQATQKMFIKSESIDGVILAYGTHHIPKTERYEVVKEAKRVLKKGGELLLHDFEENSPVEQWFKDIVDVYSTTGHIFDHFTKRELYRYFKLNGFKDIRIENMYDPFIFVGQSEAIVVEKLTNYLINMYGLTKSIDTKKCFNSYIFKRANEIFQYDVNFIRSISKDAVHKITIKKEQEQYILEMPRVGIYCFGVK